MAKKTTKKENQFNMQAEVPVSELGLNDDAVLANMLAGMEEQNDEIVEPSEIAALMEAEIEVATAPEVEVEAKPKKAKKEKVEKVAKPPRIGYVGHTVSEVLADRLGGDVAGNVILEAADAALDTSALEAKQKELLAMLDVSPTRAKTGNLEVATTQKKVAQKAVQLFDWVKNNGKLNEVMARAFTVLARDGELTSGEKGNLHAELLAKPYSVGTCRAQSGQIFALFPMLKIVTKADKGRYVLNADSLIFAKAKAELAL